MIEHPSDNNHEDETFSPREEQTGSYEKWEEPTTEQARQLGKLGVSKYREREQARQEDIKHGIGSDESELSEPEQKAANDQSYTERYRRLEEDRAKIEQLPAGFERTYQLAKNRKKIDQLKDRFLKRHGYLPKIDNPDQ